ncbi:MAG: hypothetical protein A3G81_26065 [Betaproteobacteria bacterium RIFCSPLOWO2_12_FULL_65_14]|nr:MAG: hypothetical protein A3G81_26065 [Betaproteobacteria bacterium RIFCSPLOWO2_12_FULL_65_14]
MLNREIESSLLAGHQVKFVYLDPQGNEQRDLEFVARCHFLPRVGDKVELGALQQPSAFVKTIYHRFVQSDAFEKGVFVQAVTVVLTSQEPLRETAAH